MAEQQVIDGSFFSMARHLLAADPSDRGVLSGDAWDGFLERLAETRDDWMAGWADETHAGVPVGGYARPAARVIRLAGLDAALPPGTARVTPAQRRSTLDERLRQVTRLRGC